MRNSLQPLQRIAVPLGAFAQRFMFFSLVVAAFAVMLLGKAETVVVDRARVLVADMLTPILGMASRPAGAVADAVENLRELAVLRSENERLKAQNEQLLTWVAQARHLDGENRRLRQLLQFVPEQAANQVTGRVVADSNGPFVRSVLVNAGAGDGVQRGHAALSGAGLVGRVAEVGRRSARVLLITDLNSRVPVLVESSRQRAILIGDNGPRPALQHLPPDLELAPGARIVTSGEGGVFPPGVPVGVVAKADAGVARVRPFADLERLEYLRLLDFGLHGVLWPDRQVPSLGG